MNLYEAKKLAISLIAKHNLTEWGFKFDSAKKRFGCCHYRTKTITLSKAIVALNDIPAVENVILHEIAHAIAGPVHGHDKHWKKVAKSIGCDGKRCYSTTKVSTPTARYTGTCPHCNYEIHMHRLPSRNYACGKCCKGTYNPDYVFNWADNKTGLSITIIYKPRKPRTRRTRKYRRAI